MAFRSKVPPARTGEGLVRRHRAEDPLAESRLTVNNHAFLILASERLADIGSPLEESDRAIPASKDVVETVLHRLADHGADLFGQVEGVCLHDGHMLILLTGLIDSEEQLSRWISVCTAIKSRPRIRDEKRKMA